MNIPRYFLRGRLDAMTVCVVEAELLEAVKAAERHLVLDAHALDYISSAGVRAILMALKRMRAKEGGLSIEGAGGGVHEVLELTGINALLTFPPPE